jgi:two-component system, NtrC family, sensor histidine kinase KinB
MTLFQRLLFCLLPLLVVLLLLGLGGVLLLHNLGRSASDILRENYISLKAMADMRVALAILDRSHGTDAKAHADALEFAKSASETELGNITVDLEGGTAKALDKTIRLLRFDMPADEHHRLIQDARESADFVIRLNEKAMFTAEGIAQAIAFFSIIALSITIAIGLLLAFFSLWLLNRTLVQPIRMLTTATTAIADGDLKQLVPVRGKTELALLATSFNRMAARLREYTQSNEADLIRTRIAAQATISAFADPVIVLGTDGRVELANVSAVRVFGVQVGQPWSAPDPLNQLISKANTSQRGVVMQTFDEALNIHHGEAEMTLLPQLYPIRSDSAETLGLAVVLHDVTRFRLLDRLKTDWLATVSHELKTPLTGMQLAVHVLLEELVGPLNTKQTELLLEARENADRLYRLMEQLLALAKLDDDRDVLKCATVAPWTLLRQAESEAHGAAADHHLTIAVDATDDLPMVMVDPSLMGSALGNLLSNAIRITPPGGTIALCAKATDNEVTLSVSDTGPGIPTDDLPHLFERFSQVGGDRNPRGSGLGLSIVHDIVTAHGGRVTVQSTVGQGTTFEIHLPVAKEGT